MTMTMVMVMSKEIARDREGNTKADTGTGTKPGTAG